MLQVAVGVSTMPVMQVTLETCTQQCWHKLKAVGVLIWGCCIIPLGIGELEWHLVFETSKQKLNAIIEANLESNVNCCVAMAQTKKELEDNLRSFAVSTAQIDAKLRQAGARKTKEPVHGSE